MSVKTIPTINPPLQVHISFENEDFSTENVMYFSDDNQHVIEARADDGIRFLSLFSPTEFVADKDYELVLEPSTDQARLHYHRPGPSGGQLSFYSNSGTLRFTTVAGGLNAKFESVSHAAPGNYPETVINGTFGSGRTAKGHLDTHAFSPDISTENVEYHQSTTGSRGITLSGKQLFRSDDIIEGIQIDFPHDVPVRLTLPIPQSSPHINVSYFQELKSGKRPLFPAHKGTFILSAFNEEEGYARGQFNVEIKIGNRNSTFSGRFDIRRM